jgi:hypothetical protein
MATISANAVLFIAMEMLADSSLGLLGGVDAGHRGEGLDQPDDGAQQADQRDHVGEGGQVVRALFQPRHDLHHALLHRGVDLFAAVRAGSAAQAAQPVADDLADGGDSLPLAICRALRLSLPLCSMRQELVPQRAVGSARAARKTKRSTAMARPSAMIKMLG